MNKRILINKKIGQTPLDVIKEIQTEHPDLKNEKMAYAGRLDPMAEGLLLVLVGDECKNRKSYERLQKEYEFEVLFGVETDSYDVLGIIQNQRSQNKAQKELTNEYLNQCTQSFIGKHLQPYPPYSAARVNGKPLFYWAREGKLNTVEVPEKNIEIYSLDLNSTKTISSQTLQKQIIEKILTVHGEFRQEKIKDSWKELFETTNQEEWTIAKFTITCSSGTYVRSIAHEMGKKLGTGALAFSIKRTKVGDYSLDSLVQ